MYERSARGFRLSRSWSEWCADTRSTTRGAITATAAAITAIDAVMAKTNRNRRLTMTTADRWYWLGARSWSARARYPAPPRGPARRPLPQEPAPDEPSPPLPVRCPDPHGRVVRRVGGHRQAGGGTRLRHA